MEPRSSAPFDLFPRNGSERVGQHAADWLIWQLADSAFPTGSFAHSGGLEAAWQCGQVRNGPELAGFLEAALTQAAYSSLPFVLAAYDQSDRLKDLDRLNDAFLSNHVANRASRLQGRALSSAVERIFGDQGKKSGGSCSHYAPLFGVLMQSLTIDRETMCRLFFFLITRGLISAAVRLGIVGPMEGQQIQVNAASHVEDLVMKHQDISIDDLAQTAPILDICHGLHDRLYSRLFQT